MRRITAVLVLVVSGLSLAGPSAAKSKPKPPPTPAVDPDTKKGATAASKIDPNMSSADLLAQAKALYQSLDYEQVIPFADACLARTDLTLDQRLEAFRLQGSAKAIVEDPVDAEKPFRLLLRARPDYDLPQDTPPKILAVFRKVQTEEQALAKTLHEVERSRTIAGLKLLGEPPKDGLGGRALKFSFRLRDPTGAVETIRLPYRREGQRDFSALALERSEDGDWRGAIPGEFTADEKGFKLEYYVETADKQGPLLAQGSAVKPEALVIAAGQVPTTRSRPVPKWVFFTSGGVAVLAGLAWGGTGAAFNFYQSQYTAGAKSGGQGSLLKTQQLSGERFAVFANISMVTFLTTAVLTFVLWPFTHFSDEG